MLETIVVDTQSANSANSEFHNLIAIVEAINFAFSSDNFPILIIKPNCEKWTS